MTTRPPYDPDPLTPDSWFGLPVSEDERPRSAVLIVWVAAALLCCGLVALWLAWGGR